MGWLECIAWVVRVGSVGLCWVVPLLVALGWLGCPLSLALLYWLDPASFGFALCARLQARCYFPAAVCQLKRVFAFGRLMGLKKAVCLVGFCAFVLAWAHPLVLALFDRLSGRLLFAV